MRVTYDGISSSKIQIDILGNSVYIEYEQDIFDLIEAALMKSVNTNFLQLILDSGFSF